MLVKLTPAEAKLMDEKYHAGQLWRPVPSHGYQVNMDACSLCGKSGLQLLQEGNPPCTQEARDAFARRNWVYDWCAQNQAPEAR